MSSQHPFPCQATTTSRWGRTPVPLRARPAWGVAGARAHRRVSPHPRRGAAADSVTRSRLVPAGTVGGRMAGTQKPSARSAADASRARISLPRTTGMIGLGWSGRCEPCVDGPLDQIGQAADERSAFVGSQDAQRSERRAGVGGARRGREDVGPGPVDQQIHHVTRRGDETPQRSQRLRERADPHDRRGARGGDGWAEDGVCLIEHQQRAVAGAQGHQLVDRRRIPIHGEDRVGHHDRRIGSGPGSRRGCRGPTATARGDPGHGAGRRRGRIERAGSHR